MRLPVLKALFTKNKKTPTYLLTIILRPDLIKAVVHEEISGNITFIGKGVEVLHKLVDELSIEELLEICDRAIGKAEENLPENIEAQKTIFGISDSWQSNGKITRENLEKLKRLKIDLGLSPVGFIVITDAISFALQKEEGAPINAVLVELSKKVFTVSLLRAGRIAESKTIAQEEEPVPILLEKTLKGFSNFEVLPSRIILFEGENNLEKIEQECINFPWTKNLPFLHVPRIEILPNEFDERSVVLGVASELGFSVPEFVQKTKEDTFRQAKDEHVEKEEDKLAEKERSKKEEFLSDELAFGFVREKDAIEEFVTKEEKQSITPLTFFKQYIPSRFIPSLTNLPSLPKIKIPPFRRILFLPIFILSLLLIFILFSMFLLRAEVRIHVLPKNIEQEKIITIDPDLPAETEAEKVKGETISVTREGQKQIPTSGKKEIGDKAKGEITIYNSTQETRTFAKGTVVSTSGKLKFTLDSQVTVASASGDVFSGTTPSKEKVSVTAEAIGEESNVAAQTTFTIGGQSLVAAKNDTALTGGSKREVRVVAKKDQDTLLEELLEQFREEAKGELANKGVDIRIIDIVSEKTLTRKFDKKIDEEAGSLTLSLTVEFEALGFRDESVKGLFEKSLVGDVNDKEFKLSDNGIEFSVVKQEKARDGSIKVTFSGKGKFIPTFDIEKIKKEIAFTSKNRAENYIKSLPNVSGVEVIVFPPLPFVSKNISITVSASN